MLVSEVPALRNYWYPVAYSSDVVTEPHPTRLFDEPFVVCPYHGWRYDSSGMCTSVPSQDPRIPIPSRARLSNIAVQERYGLVWVCVGPAPVDGPVLEELEDSGYTLIHELTDVWKASAPRIIDNALDVSHVAFVHRGTVGDPEHPRMSDFTLERDGHRIRFSVTYTSVISDLQATNTGMPVGLVTRSTHAELVQPFVFRGVLEYENGLRHVLYKTCTPVDDRTTLFHQFIARNDAPPPERWGDITAMDRAVQSEDRVLLEAIDPDYPIDLTVEVHTRADRMTIEYRRILADLAAGNPDGTPRPGPERIDVVGDPRRDDAASRVSPR
jgi:phenylpropionate dioxygenase-like ring-hydroxylating dioxygenase large terminal subunit